MITQCTRIHVCTPHSSLINDDYFNDLNTFSLITSEDEYLTTKQLASVRFHRNHRLMAEIFSDVVVPDTRSVVSSSRLEALKQQSKSLEVHQKKLEDEVCQLEAKYTNKRAKFLDDAERFRKELRKVGD